MSGPIDTDRSARHEKLLKQKLASLLDWRVPQIEETIGPFDPAAFEEYEARRGKVIDACVEKLTSYSEEDVDLLIAPPSDDSEAVRKGWETFRSAEIRELTGHPPPWYAGGFGHPAHAADLEYWSKMPHYSLEEVVCLSVGVEPGDFPPEKLQKLQAKEQSGLWPQLQFLIRQYEQLKRQFDPQSRNRSVQPHDFLDWASRVHFPLHPDFERLLRRYHLSESKEPDQSSSAMTDTRETRTIAGLFTLLAIDHLGYDPESKRSPIPKEIVDIAASKGVSVSEDTVRKYLRIGAEKIRKGGQEE